MNELTHLDLFSGIGGFALAAQRAGFRTVGFSEVEPYACAVLSARFPGTPNFGDINKLCRRVYDCDPIDEETGECNCPRCGVEFGDCACIGTDQFTDTHGFPTVITAGFPCQPYSVIGKRAGANDSRNLWPQACRVISELHPAWFIGENVPGLIGMALDQVWSDLENEGYSVQAFTIPACGVDARHKRERLWILGHANDAGSPGFPGNVSNWQRRAEPRGPGCAPNLPPRRVQEWPAEPGLGRVANGIPNRAHRLKCLGNAIVPQVVEPFFHWIAQIERGEIA